MNPYCECPAAGFCKRHQIHKGEQRFNHCKGISRTAGCGVTYWNAWEQGKLGATAPPAPVLNPPGFCETREYVEEGSELSSIGTELHEIIKRETGIDVPCAECRARIASLNRMNAAQAMAKKPEMVEAIAQQAKQNTQTLLQKLGVAIDSAFNLGIVKARIGEWFDEAVELGTANSRMRPGSVPRPTTAEIVVAPMTHQRQVERTRKTSAAQNRLFDFAKSTKPTPRPFKERPKVNLVFHMWPRAGGYEWHVERLRDLIPRCDGRILIGITPDHDTVSAEQVISEIGCDRAEYLINPNVNHHSSLNLRGARYGELQTAIPAMQRLAGTEDSVTIYAHAKGMQNHTIKARCVRLWTEMMYESVIFNIDQCIQKIEEGYSICGSFRTFGLRPLMARHKWHFSGTFYTFRTRDLINQQTAKPFQMRYGGTEAWPGDHVSIERSHCFFADNSPLARQYDYEMMKAIIGDQLVWESKQHGPGPDMEQHVREFAWFIDQIQDCRSILIIGSRRGGMEHRISARCPHVENILSIDPDPLRENTARLIRGSSHDPEVQRLAASLGPWDAVFIDGDHSENGVRQDWDFAKSLQPKRIFFHDFTDAEYHPMNGCYVNLVWDDVVREAAENNWQISSKAVGCGWGGIGQVKMR